MSEFVFRQAVREQTPLLLGLIGPSGSGKTFSALRLATGIQSIVGGEIAAIDTEARRMLHYAGRFKFMHMEFQPPHGPDRYLAAIEAAVKAGAKTIIIDSMSHEHEGAGGVLEMHESELDRMAGDDWKKRESCNMIAWAKPKAARRKLINRMLQINANFVMCFRAKEKIKIVKNAQGKNQPQDAGWQAIAGEEFVYEMTDRFLLPPGVEGRPDFSEEAMATGAPKISGEHRDIIRNGMQIDENMGVALARWAIGGDDALPQRVIDEFRKVNVSLEGIEQYLGHKASLRDVDALRTWLGQIKREQKAQKAKPVQFDETAFAQKLRQCTDPEVLSLVADEIRDIADEEAQSRMQNVYLERYEQLNNPSA